MDIKFPRGVVVDIDNVPDDFDDKIRNAFAEYTKGTNSAYRNHDKLSFVDCCVRLIRNFRSGEESVRRIVMKCVDHHWTEYGELPDTDEIMDAEFIGYCYEEGRKEAALYGHYSESHRVNDAVMNLLYRAIKVVMNYEEDEDGH